MTPTTALLTLESTISSTPMLYLAQADAAPPVAGRSDGGAVTGESGQPLGGGGGSAPPPTGMGFQFMFLMGGLLLFMILMQVFAGRKEKKRRAEMLGSLRRHDRVVTIGGIIGHVAEVRDDEVVLKVDESTNTKIRVTRAAVQSVLKKSSAEERPVAEAAKA